MPPTGLCSVLSPAPAALAAPPRPFCRPARRPAPAGQSRRRPAPSGRPGPPSRPSRATQEAPRTVGTSPARRRQPYSRSMPLRAKVLTVSDGVIAGTRDDRSGAALVDTLEAAGFTVLDRRVVVDGVDTVASALTEMAEHFAGLIVTTGGTGFSPRDLTPEGTKAVIDREAPGLAEAMRLVNPLGRLSRAAAGTLGTAIVVNTPGSTTGSVECLKAVIEVLPHALALLAGEPTRH